MCSRGCLRCCKRLIPRTYTLCRCDALRKKIKARQRNEAELYLCDLISGVPFHSQQDLGEDLRHVEAVLSGRRIKEQLQNFCAVIDGAETFDVACEEEQAHLCLQRKSFSCSVISDSGSRLHTCRSWSLSLSVSGLSRASLLLCVIVITRIDVSTAHSQRGGGLLPHKTRDLARRCDDVNACI